MPTGREDQTEWKKWNPHGSYHKDGRFHHKSFNRKIFPQQRQKPDANFVGTENLVTLGISSERARAFGVVCDPKDFFEVMEVHASLIQPNVAEKTLVSIDLTEPGGKAIITPGGRVITQRAFSDSTPSILVTVFAWGCVNPSS